jgi:hypothetical protein
VTQPPIGPGSEGPREEDVQRLLAKPTEGTVRIVLNDRRGPYRLTVKKDVR